MSKYDPKVIELTGKEVSITAADIARAMWLARKFTSLTYIQRMASLWSNFVAGYEDFAKRDPVSDQGPCHRAHLARFYEYQAALTEGIERIRRRDSEGYARIFAGCYLRDRVLGRPVEGGVVFEDVGWQMYPTPHEGLFAWAVVAADMCAYVDTTLGAEWAFPWATHPLGITFPPLESLPPTPKPTGIVVKTGESVPVSGIWMPALPSGASNYLWEGNDAWKGRRVTRQIDYPEVIDEEMPQVGRTDYGYDTEPTTWTLLWEDDRYKDGRVPDEEAGYLDASTEPPPWPPIVPPEGAKLKPPIFRGK